MEMNPAQAQAIATTKGRVLVLAGPGSGKTRVIVHRIGHLIRSGQAAPEQILGLTFTNKAAEEMRLRLRSLIGEAAKNVHLSTFHSFCMRVLRKTAEHLGYTREFSLYDEGDMQRLTKQVARDLLRVEELPMEKTWSKTFVAQLDEQLQCSLRAYNAVSFDHLITLTLQLFEASPDILKSYHDRYSYLMVDEYQDTNPPQCRLAELLAQREQNLCVVGDDDQSIYGWRGAIVANILGFKADHTIRLEQNYRSQPAIVAIAKALIDKNKERHAKKLWTAKPEEGEVELFHAPSEIEEAEGVVQRVISLKEKGLRWKEIAILYRSNILSRPFETILIRQKIPYVIFGGIAFSQRSEIKDLFAYLRVIANPLDAEALLRILNVPRRGISDAQIDYLTQINRKQKIPLWALLASPPADLTAAAKKGIDQFVQVIEQAVKRFAEEPLHEAGAWLIEAIDYRKAIAQETKNEQMRLWKWSNIQESIDELAHFAKTTSEPSLQEFVAQSLLQNQFREAAADERDSLQMMTFHSAKGLEFPACFLVGLEDHILPHEKSIAQTGIEEERRLFYVGITRAQKFLTFSMARTRSKMGKPIPTRPSRFLYELPKNLLQVRDWRAPPSY